VQQLVGVSRDMACKSHGVAEYCTVLYSGTKGTSCLPFSHQHVTQLLQAIDRTRLKQSESGSTVQYSTVQYSTVQYRMCSWSQTLKFASVSAGRYTT
jgi:hypothetical protein